MLSLQSGEVCEIVHGIAEFCQLVIRGRNIELLLCVERAWDVHQLLQFAHVSNNNVSLFCFELCMFRGGLAPSSSLETHLIHRVPFSAVARGVTYLFR